MHWQELQTRKSSDDVGDILQFQHLRNIVFNDDSEQKSWNNWFGALWGKFVGKLISSGSKVWETKNGDLVLEWREFAHTKGIGRIFLQSKAEDWRHSTLMVFIELILEKTEENRCVIYKGKSNLISLLKNQDSKTRFSSALLLKMWLVSNEI